ncbi:hypothetical protein DUNSADRAFT_17085, partial [Dunaliella salina]
MHKGYRQDNTRTHKETELDNAGQEDGRAQGETAHAFMHKGPGQDNAEGQENAHALGRTAHACTHERPGHNGASSSNPTGFDGWGSTATDYPSHSGMRSMSLPPKWRPQQNSPPRVHVSAFKAASFGALPCGTAFGSLPETPDACIDDDPLSQIHDRTITPRHSSKGKASPAPGSVSCSRPGPAVRGLKHASGAAGSFKKGEPLARPCVRAHRRMTEPNPCNESELQPTSDHPRPLVGSISSCPTSGNSDTPATTPLPPLPPLLSSPLPCITDPLPGMTKASTSGTLPDLSKPVSDLHDATLPDIAGTQSCASALMQRLKGLGGHEGCTATAKPKLAHWTSVGLGGCSSMNTDTSITTCVKSVGTGKSDANESWVGASAAMLPSLLAEGQQAKMASVMAEVGLDLLHHALVEGLPVLADRLMCGLLGAPFHLPFDLLMLGRLPAVIQQGCCLNAAPQQQQQQQQQQELQQKTEQQQQQQQQTKQQHQQQQKTSKLQHAPQALRPKCTAGAEVPACALSSHPSLLTSALLSGCSQTVSLVLQWGSQHGE